MTRTQRRIVGLLAGAGVVLGLLAGLPHLAGRPEAPRIDPAALSRLAAQNFQDVAGGERTLAAWSGKTLVVNFWATWCPPCRKEMPIFSRLHTALAERGVVFVGIGIDSPSALKEYALQSPVSYPLLIGGSDGLELLKTLGNERAALPYTLVLDPAGRPAVSQLGMIDEASFEARLRAVAAPAR